MVTLWVSGRSSTSVAEAVAASMEMQVLTARIDARSFFVLFKLVILSSSYCQINLRTTI